MKIKLSKSQWEMVGKKAGWMKVAEDKKSKKVCKKCKEEDCRCALCNKCGKNSEDCKC